MAPRCSSVLAWQSILSLQLSLAPCRRWRSRRPTPSTSRSASMSPAPPAAASTSMPAWSAAISASTSRAIPPSTCRSCPAPAASARPISSPSRRRKDGTAITTFASGPILEPLIGARDPGYDMSQFTWIGAVTKDIGLCMALGDDAVQDHRGRQEAADGRRRHRRGFGDRHLADRAQRGARHQVQAGHRLSRHPGNHHRHRARRSARPLRVQLSALKTSKPDWMRDHKINVLVQLGAGESRRVPGRAAVFDLVSKPEDRQLIELMVGPGAMARPFAAPPGLPANKAALLRRAFDATMKDPEFLAEAGKDQGRHQAHDRRGRAEAGRPHLRTPRAGGRAGQEVLHALVTRRARLRPMLHHRPPKT